MTTKLNDLQSLLLSTASNRKSGCLLPLPKKTACEPERLDAAIGSLLRRKLAEKAGEQVIITDAGRRAIGIEEPAAALVKASPASTDLNEPVTEASARRTKSALVIDLISRPEGAGADELMNATGWLPHTVRAALTGLRKKGMTVDRVKENGASRYRLSA